MKRTASAVWTGDLLSGTGKLDSSSGAFSDLPYSFKTRFEDAPGTNPEELIGAAHAGCFSMALSGALGKAGLKPERVSTTAAVSLEKDEGGFSITGVHLSTKAKVPGATQADFERIANEAKAGCPVSRSLAVPITLDATLEA